MHSPPHINVAKLFNWASYDCCHFADICKWWLSTIATLNPINSPKWLHLSKKIATFAILCLSCVAPLATTWTFKKRTLVAVWLLVQPDRGIAMDRLTCQLIVTCWGLYCHTRSYNQWWLKCTASVFDFGEYCSDSPCAYGTTYAVSRVSIFQFNFGKIFPPWTSTCPCPLVD
jgi:hypothetical protein